MEGMKCNCGKIAEYDKSMKFHGYNMGGWKCKSCGKAYCNPEKTEKIISPNKLKRSKMTLEDAKEAMRNAKKLI